METFASVGGVMVYSATCGLLVVPTVPGATIDTVAESDFVGSFLLVAVTVALAFCATVGAVKLPFASIVPVVEVPPGIPFTPQVTPDVSPITVAVNVMVWAEPTNAGFGETETLIGSLSITG